MRRIYKVLLPHYKKDEMDREIQEEWIFDSQGRNDLDYNMLVLVLFRIAHSWAVHIDYEEYVFLLYKIYERITCKVVVNTGSRVPVLPKIVVSFPDEERKLNKKADGTEGEVEHEGDGGAEWIE